MPHAITNGIVTFYEDSGRARPEPGRRGPPLVLIHGHSSDLRLWDAQGPALADAGYRVVRYDVRGHGRSDAPATGYTWQNYSCDLRDLLEHLGIATAHLVGLSMGGGIALQFALDWPDHLSSLVLVDSTLPGFDYSAQFSQSVEELVAAVRSEGPRSAFQRLWLSHPLFDGVRRFPERFQFLKSLVLAYPAADYYDQTEYPQPQRQVSDRLGEVQAPTLVLVGELDLPDFRLVADILAANIPGARQQVIADAGHLPPLEQPAAFNAALLDFLSRLAPD
ncbi:MAG: alpha/beta fold hydrolase [Chloroflexota bacterium]|nr:alpha/beta fold hydrolase [Chloroflexota bacterium]